METEKKYTTAYGKLRRLTSTIDGQIRQISVSDSLWISHLLFVMIGV